MIGRIVGLLVAILLSSVITIFIPFGLIWAVNTLFNQHIGYTFINWLAAALLYFILKGTTKSNSNKDV